MKVSNFQLGDRAEVDGKIGYRTGCLGAGGKGLEDRNPSVVVIGCGQVFSLQAP